METLKTGALAYVDSMAGLLPCKVKAIRPNIIVAQGEPVPHCDGIPSSSQWVTVELTADKGPYTKGETMEGWGLRFVPRKAANKGQYGNRIRPYTVICDK
jgi:hypothetical protein